MCSEFLFDNSIPEATSVETWQVHKKNWHAIFLNGLDVDCELGVFGNLVGTDMCIVNVEGV